jgi:TetR/AcrR family transcriptional regulator, cholesterol catabolism regulator
MISTDRILDTSAALFMKKGFKAVTMDDIAAANGISKRTLYEVFKDKSSLLQACIEEMNRRGVENIKVMKAESKNVLEMFLKLHHFKTDAMMKIHTNFFEELKRYYPEVYDNCVLPIQKNNIEMMRELFENGKEQGVFLKFTDPQIAALHLHKVTQGVSSMSIEDPSKYSLRYILDHTILPYLRGISTEIGIKTIDQYLSIIDENTNNNNN